MSKNHVLEKRFETREALIKYVHKLAPWARGEASPMVGGHKVAHQSLQNIDPVSYGKTRNFGDGKITMLSPYVHHGVISLNEIRNYALTKCSDPKQITKFIQELGWRDFWQRVAELHPEWLW